MKNTQYPRAFALFFATLMASSSFGIVAAEDFAEITDVPQTVSSFDASLTCFESEGSVPLTQFTVEPAASVTVSSSPPDLVSASASGDTLTLKWNSEVANTAQSGGVKIGFPADQLKSVSVGSGQSVQVLDGFTSVSSLSCDTGGDLTAIFSSASAAVDFSVADGSKGAVKSNANVVLKVASGAWAVAEAPSSDLDASPGANVSIKGDIGSAKVQPGANVKISGAATGTIDEDWGANVETGVAVDGVDTSTKPLTISGTVFCNYADPGAWLNALSGSTSAFSCGFIGITVTALAGAYLAM